MPIPTWLVDISVPLLRFSLRGPTGWRRRSKGTTAVARGVWDPRAHPGELIELAFASLGIAVGRTGAFVGQRSRKQTSRRDFDFSESRNSDLPRESDPPPSLLKVLRSTPDFISRATAGIVRTDFFPFFFINGESSRRQAQNDPTFRKELLFREK